METWNQIQLKDWTIGTLITYHDNGSLQVRINRGQQWAWQIISVSEDDAEFINAPEEDEEEPINNQPPTMRPSNNTILTIIAVVIVLLALAYNNTKKPQSEIEIMTNQLNQMNIADIADIGSCKSLKDRQKEKKILLEKIQKMY